MGCFTSKYNYMLCVYIMLFQSFKPVLGNRALFKLISGTDERNNLGEREPRIRKEFFQCGREKSCTHVIKVANGYVLVYGSDELRKIKDKAVCIYEKVKIQERSCLALYYNGIRANGHYEIVDQNGLPFPVFCDFDSETSSIWTLVSSFSLANNTFHKKPFFENEPRSEGNPNWVDYRLGLTRMKDIRTSSTMWRATCTFPAYKADIYRDYVRAQLKDIDILEFFGHGLCRNVDYINIRGNEGSNITSAFWQGGGILHIDSSIRLCQYDARNGVTPDEDNFGWYDTYSRAFRCTETDGSTTQYWFGGKI